METPTHSRFTFEVNDEEHSLRILGKNKKGQDVSGYARWNTPDEMNRNIEKFITAFEKALDVSETMPEADVAGAFTPGATTSLKNLKLPIGKLTFLRFRNHEYDEGCLIVLNHAIQWDLTESGWPILPTLRPKPRESKTGHFTIFGIGGAKNAWSVAYLSK